MCSTLGIASVIGLFMVLFGVVLIMYMDGKI